MPNPTYNDAQSRFNRDDQITPRASAALTTVAGTENGAVFSTADVNTLDLLLDVTVVATSPSLACKVQTGNLADGSDMADVASFAAKTTVSSERKRFTGLGKFCRIVSTVTGAGASATFSVSGTAK